MSPLPMAHVVSFGLPPGARFAPGAVQGYAIDMRRKAPSSAARTYARDDLHVPAIQAGLGCYERFLAGEGEEWLAAAVEIGDGLVARQRERDGAWVHHVPCPHTYRLPAPWLSAMAQGQGASLLVRLAHETGQERHAAAALRALEPLRVPTRDGGVSALLDGRPFPEEYPTDPASHVLNGAIFALWGCHDVGAGLGDADAARMFEEGLETIAATVGHWDTGSWSRYDLYPHPVVNVATPAYHRLHISLLGSLAAARPRPELLAAIERFERYAGRPLNVAGALARKVVFRVRVPRWRRR
jgi:hypothetical protein